MSESQLLTLQLRTPEDIVRMRRATRDQAIALAFSLVEQTKIVTAASEIGRNTILYGGGGEVTLQAITEATRRGLRLVFSDRGPGIADIALALTDGHTTGIGLGLGLGGAQRLCNEFSIESTSGGTRVTIARWK